jgi:2Fe-2S ferredoxin
MRINLLSTNSRRESLREIKDTCAESHLLLCERGERMVEVTFVEHDGARRTVDIPDGVSAMEGALRHHIPGIEGDCGGACACATCHVYVDPAWSARLDPPSELEMSMLRLVLEPTERSRLACQIKLRPNLNGLVLETPKSQY